MLIQYFERKGLKSCQIKETYFAELNVAISLLCERTGVTC